jgi:hypothetical protein
MNELNPQVFSICGQALEAHYGVVLSQLVNLALCRAEGAVARLRVFGAEGLRPAARLSDVSFAHLTILHLLPRAVKKKNE